MSVRLALAHDRPWPGAICGKYHKLQLAEGHLADGSCWYNDVGQRGRAFDTPLGRIGFLICNDRWNADLARLPVLDGARLLLIPSYGQADATNDATVLARARENGVAVVEANVGLLMMVRAFLRRRAPPFRPSPAALARSLTILARSLTILATTLMQVSRGEVVAREKRPADPSSGRVTDAYILVAGVDVPAPPTEPNYRAWEAAFLEWRGPAMEARFRRRDDGPA
jgi:predicted amidohydrolase